MTRLQSLSMVRLVIADSALLNNTNISSTVGCEEEGRRRREGERGGESERERERESRAKL